MHWFGRDKTEKDSTGPTKVWALVFDEDEHRYIDLHLPRYLYFAKQEPKKWNRIRWRDIVTGSCIVRIGWRLYILSARPPSSLEVSTSAYATADPSGSCLVASTATIPTPIRTIYLGVAEYESSTYGYALIQLDTVYLQGIVAGERLTGISFGIDREWLQRRGTAPLSILEERFWLRKAEKPKSNGDNVNVVGNHLDPHKVSLLAEDRGALVMGEDGKAIGISLGYIESQDDPEGRNVVKIIPFDKLFWQHVARHAKPPESQEHVYEVWVDMIIE
ncbi:hypothetical protein K449DRAFT_50914 [Hypoxylon sp. EC38]|nr:hypothetical protein K449DRAFT_50914 [Hypoxylon sp. EC38]